ncbi:MAG: substrate-binding periplasmic protein [Desulfococcaceae bacterium]
MKKVGFFLIPLLPLLLAPPAFGQAESLTINTAFSGPVRRIFEAVVLEAGKRLDISVSVRIAQADEGLRMVETGEVDGDGPRIGGLQQTFPGMVQVPETIVAVDFSGFSKDPTIPTDDWSDLLPYRTGVVSGWKILENRLVDARALHRMGDIDSLFRMLEIGRIDVAVIDRMEGEAFLREFSAPGVRPLSPPLETREMFLYLNARHRALAGRIADVLAAMKADGTHRRIVEAVSGP